MVLTMRLLVRNMARKTTETDLRDLFESFGPVQSCVIVNDAETGQSKGFGFVEMPKVGDAKEAIRQLNGHEIDGEMLRVKRST
jgi:RNA recognition motif-containing protein